MSNVRSLRSKEEIENLKKDEFVRLAEIIGIERAREIINELYNECRKAEIIQLKYFR